MVTGGYLIYPPVTIMLMDGLSLSDVKMVNSYRDPTATVPGTASPVQPDMPGATATALERSIRASD